MSLVPTQSASFMWLTLRGLQASLEAVAAAPDSIYVTVNLCEALYGDPAVASLWREAGPLGVTFWVEGVELWSLCV